MAKQQLTATTAKAKRKTGLHADGGGLYLQVTAKGHRSWVYRFRIHKRLRTMGLGAFPATSLKAARDAHSDAKKLRDAGIDPIIARGQKRQVAAKASSTQHACEAYIEAQKAKWRTKSHVKQIKRRLAKYVYPVVGHVPISDLKGAEARQVLVPIWKTLNPTASRIRQYMEDTVNWAIHEGIRTDESNPFEIKRLEFALPFGIHKVTSHPALSFERAPAFLAEVRQQKGVKAKALEFTLLCGTRIGDIVGGGKDHSLPLCWDHIDWTAAIWHIPDTKMNRPFDVALSEPAMRLLGEMRQYKDPESDYVFPGSKAGSVISAATLRKMLKDMGYAGMMTTHGCRSMLRTFASETTNFEKDVIEATLAHAPGELDSAYHRGSYFAKRRLLMAAWADFCGGCTIMQGAEVIKSAA